MRLPPTHNADHLDRLNEMYDRLPKAADSPNVESVSRRIWPDEYLLARNDVASWIATLKAWRIVARSTGRLTTGPGTTESLDLVRIDLSDQDRAALPSYLIPASGYPAAWFVRHTTDDQELGAHVRVTPFLSDDTEAAAEYERRAAELRAKAEQYKTNLRPEQQPEDIETAPIPPEWDEVLDALTTGFGGAEEPYEPDTARRMVRRMIRASRKPEDFFGGTE